MGKDLLNILKNEKGYLGDKELKIISSHVNDLNLAWLEGLKKIFAKKSPFVMEYYNTFKSFLPEEYCSKDITLFCEQDMMRSPLIDNPSIEKELLYDIGQNCLGIYLSALINNCKDNTILIDTNKIPDLLISKFGYVNKSKEIIINGNIGEQAGYHMFGGVIRVHGDAYFNVGYQMKGGEIIVSRKAAAGIGEYMTGGVIRIESGDYYSLAKTMFGGDIYHKGKLVVKDEKKL